MSLPLPDDATDPQLAAEYGAAREREGRVMAILRALGPRPELVRAFVSMADAALYGPAALDRREREVLAHATSEANGARYSASIHAALRDELGPPGPRDDALAAFAHRLTQGPGEAQAAVADLRAALAPGSYVAISHSAAEGFDLGSTRPDSVERGQEIYRRQTATPITVRTREQILPLFAGTQLVEPGLVWMTEWRPAPGDPTDFADDPPRSGQWAGVGVLG